MMSGREAGAVAEFLLQRHTPLCAASAAVDEKRPDVDPVDFPLQAIEEGHACQECGRHGLLGRSVTRGDGSRREFLACEACPQSCQAIYPLPAVGLSARIARPLPSAPVVESASKSRLVGARKADDACPWCKEGKLVERRGDRYFSDAATTAASGAAGSGTTATGRRLSR